MFEEVWTDFIYRLRVYIYISTHTWYIYIIAMLCFLNIVFWVFLHKSIWLAPPMTLRRQVDFGRLMMNIRAEEQKADLQTRDLEENTTEIGWHAKNSTKKTMGVKGAKGKTYRILMNLESWKQEKVEKTHKQFLTLMSILRLPYEFPREFPREFHYFGLTQCHIWLSCVTA